MPRIDIEAVPTTTATSYPQPYAQDVVGRIHRNLTPVAGLRDFGVRHVRLEPGAWSSQRHWHDGEDEFLVMLSGEAVLVEEGTETLLCPGDCAAFPMGVANGHHLINRSDTACVFIAFGRNSDTDCHYPDVDLHLDGPSDRYLHKDGRPYD